MLVHGDNDEVNDKVVLHDELQRGRARRLQAVAGRSREIAPRIPPGGVLF